jgi:bifunctional ADP-heptose synthase (sugar kinase/adenylyltransferase)
MAAAPAFEAKICPPADLPARIAALARPLVFTNGCFDILHRGHATYLAQARALGASLLDRKSTRLNSSHNPASRMPSSA